MKQHLSVFMLLARSTIYPIAGLLLLTAAAEAGLFWAVLGSGAAAELPALLDKSRGLWVFGACFLLTTLLLSLTGCEFSAKTGCTLRRLSVSERQVFLWQWGYNTAVYFLLWAVQLLLALGLCALYLRRADPALVNSQTVFLAFYRSPFLHSLLPLEDTGLWVRNAALCLGLGASAAFFPFRQRQGRRDVTLILLTAAALRFFPCALGSFGNVMWMAILAAACALFCVYRVFQKEGEPYAD